MQLSGFRHGQCIRAYPEAHGRAQGQGAEAAREAESPERPPWDGALPQVARDERC